MKAYVNGRIIATEKAALSIADRGLLYGDGLFETIRVQEAVPLRLHAHLQRLSAGAHILGFGPALDSFDFPSALRMTLWANGLSSARARITVTRGPSGGPGGLLPDVGARPTIIVTVDPLPEAAPEPARVIISSVRRDQTSPLCRVKSLNYLPGILARVEAERAGADDALMLNMQGSVAEGTVANLFLARGKTLVTPSLDQGPLPGTARAAVIAVAPSLGLEVVEAAVPPADLFGADELFFTNAIALARPICEVDGRPIGSGRHDIARTVADALAV